MKFSYRFIFIFVLFVFAFTDANAAGDEKNPEITLETPRNTILIHLAYLQNDNFQPEKAARALQIDDAAESRKAQNLAIKLKKVLDGKGLYVDIDALPNDPDYADTTDGKRKYVLFSDYPGIFVAKIGDKWLYPKESLKRVEQIYSEMFPIETDDLEKVLPPVFFTDFLGAQLWQYAGLLAYFAVSVLIYFLFNLIFGQIIINLLSKTKLKSIASKYIQPMARPVSVLVVILSFDGALPLLQFPVEVNAFFGYIVKIAVPITVIAMLYQLIDMASGFFSKLADKTATTLDDSLIPLIRKTLKILVVIFGLIYILQNLSVNIVPLLAGVSIGGLAFALAAQDMIKNFFGSITIFTDKPFQPGDWIVAAGVEGTVEEVGVRSTRIRTFYDSLVSLPNGKLADAVIDNMGRRNYRRYTANIAMTYDTPPDLIDAFVEGLKAIVHNHPKTRKDYYQIHMHNFGDSSLNVLFYIFFDAADWTEELEARHEVICEVIRLASEIGVRFAFPTNTIFVEEFPGEKSLSPVHEMSKEQYVQNIREFVKKRLESNKSDNIK